MRLLFKFCTILLLVHLVNTNSRADNPTNLFGIELGQDVFELSSIEKLGSAHMNFKIEPNNPLSPFDLYSVKADYNFRVQSVFAMAKVSTEACENELKKTIHQLESNLGVTFYESPFKKKTVYLSEDDKTTLVISCNRYRKYRDKQLKDITLILASKDKIPKSIEADKEKSQKMNAILRKNRIKNTEIKLESIHDFSGVWSINCVDNKSGILINKLRDNTYHFLLCSSFKCINMPRVSSDGVEIVDNNYIKILGQKYKHCVQ